MNALQEGRSADLSVLALTAAIITSTQVIFSSLEQRSSRETPKLLIRSCEKARVNCSTAKAVLVRNRVVRKHIVSAINSKSNVTTTANALAARIVNSRLLKIKDTKSEETF